MAAQFDNDLLDVRDRLIERVVILAAIDTPAQQIAAAVGLTEVRLAQIINAPVIAAKIQETKAQALEQAKSLNDGWDAIEESSMGHILEYMTTTKDPEYALRAAKVANTAQRRGRNGALSGVINGTPNAVAVINLSAVFVQKLQSMRIGPADLSREAHIIDAMPVTEVEKFMQPQDDVTVSLADIFQGQRI